MKQRHVATTDSACVIVAPSDDVHAQVVYDELVVRGARVVRVDVERLLESQLCWSPGEALTLYLDGTDWRIDSASTVWWRRPHFGGLVGYEELEARLVEDETRSLFPGMLEAAAVRWVDSPWVLLRARWKPYQLTIANRHGLRHPPTLITGSPRHAARFAEHDVVLAKAASTGIGIAPFADVVPHSQLDRVASCPTLLQHVESATADVRAVTVGRDVFVWQRPRSTDARNLDWRAEDPQGVDFKPVASDSTEGGANTMSTALGLGFSVQDWLLSPEGPVFLEVNPQGQWLFLENSARMVAPTFADYLSSVAGDRGSE